MWAAHVHGELIHYTTPHSRSSSIRDNGSSSPCTDSLKTMVGSGSRVLAWTTCICMAHRMQPYYQHDARCRPGQGAGGSLNHREIITCMRQMQIGKDSIMTATEAEPGSKADRELCAPDFKAPFQSASSLSDAAATIRDSS